MGVLRWLTTTAESPTLTAKAKKAARTKLDDVELAMGNGLRCQICDKPLVNRSQRSNVHPRCARGGGL
ncbi:hypothetical protein M8C13_40350 [Crossiella sp. SN42]|uniref:hypothetical protein n=1 Tax=Crossiella sp. SN42 TaxID=2944808 RepID=UPI00207C6E41|nr:hypothetical protein [Crossiella sp. SN42]MCO1582019.1 hypothetical protein [Crossiella sp. SN42]